MSVDPHEAERRARGEPPARPIAAEPEPDPRADVGRELIRKTELALVEEAAVEERGRDE